MSARRFIPLPCIRTVINNDDDYDGDYGDNDHQLFISGFHEIYDDYYYDTERYDYDCNGERGY